MLTRIGFRLNTGGKSTKQGETGEQIEQGKEKGEENATGSEAGAAKNGKSGEKSGASGKTGTGKPDSAEQSKPPKKSTAKNAGVGAASGKS